MGGTFGYYGKIAEAGDFVGRGLAPEVTAALDAWLQQVLLDSRAVLGDDWLPAYLSMPVWRFAMTAGLCGPDTLIGAIMPSIDRVGRHFPLVIATTLSERPPAAMALDAMADRAPAVTGAALATLQVDARRGDLDQAVAALPAVREPGRVAQRSRREGPLHLGAPSGRGMAAIAAALLAADYARPSLWIADADGTEDILIFEGLPTGLEAATLVAPQELVAAGARGEAAR